MVNLQRCQLSKTSALWSFYLWVDFLVSWLFGSWPFFLRSVPCHFVVWHLANKPLVEAVKKRPIKIRPNDENIALLPICPSAKLFLTWSPLVKFWCALGPIVREFTIKTDRKIGTVRVFRNSPLRIWKNRRWSVWDRNTWNEIRTSPTTWATTTTPMSTVSRGKSLSSETPFGTVGFSFGTNFLSICKGPTIYIDRVFGGIKNR